MATNQLTRRTILRTTVATAALAVPVALASGIMAAAVASSLPALPPALAAVPRDPLIGLVAAMRRANRRLNLADDRGDAAALVAHEAGWNVRHPFLLVGRYGCSSVGMVVDACQPNDQEGPPVEEMPAYVREYRRLLAQKRRQRKAAGLDPFDAKVAAAKREFYRLERVIATTPAVTMAGLVVKLRLVKLDIEDGASPNAGKLIAGALADAKRLAGGAS